MKKFSNYIPLLILVLLIISISLAIYKASDKSSDNAQSEPSESQFNTELVKQKIKLPDFSLPDVFDENKTFTLQNFINDQGKYSLLNFFASWCSTCKMEHEILLRLKDENFIDIYAIAWHDFKTNTQEYLQKYGNPYKQVALDSQGIFTKITGIKAVPETLVIDASGTVVLRYQGNLDDEVIKDIKNYIKNK